MFDKVDKLVRTFLVAVLVGVVAWFCWTRRDAGRFTFHQRTTDGVTVVFDGRTGVAYFMLLGGPVDAWVEMQPQTGRAIRHQIARPEEKVSTGQTPQTGTTDKDKAIEDRLLEVMKHPKGK